MLVNTVDLSRFLQRGLDVDSAVVAVRVAEGWLRSATRLTAWPDPVPEDLWSWALELAAMAYDNPTGVGSRTTGGEADAGLLDRRADILRSAALRYGSGVDGGVGPVFSFPAPVPWPL